MDIEKLKILYDKDLSNRQIAKEMNCNHKTVASHLAKIGLKSKRLSSSVPKLDIKEKVCSKCDILQPISNYQRGRRGKEYEYEYSYCNSCRKAQSYAALNNNFEAYLKDKVRRWKNQALTNGHKFELDYDFLFNMYTSQAGKCFYTDTELVWGVKTKSRNIISLDKIIPDKGYIPNNVVLCTNMANTIKSDQTMEQLKQWMPDWYQRIQTRNGDF